MNAKVKGAGQSRREMREAERHRKRLLQRAAMVLAGVVALVLAGYAVWGQLQPKPGQSVPQLPRTHIQLGVPHEPYNSDPPTSGPHAGPVEAGFYDAAPPDENLVHNLEHGYVVIWYNCSALDEAGCEALKTQIKAVMDRARPVVVTTNAKKLIAVPRPTMDARLALTSWGRIDKLSSFDDMRVMEFVTRLRNQAPEPGAP